MLLADNGVRSGSGHGCKRFGRFRPDRSLAVSFLLTLLTAAPVVKAQNFLTATAPKETASDYRSSEGLTGDNIIARMIEGNRLRDERLQNYSSVRTYEIRNPDGRVSAQAVVRVAYRAPGSKTFLKISEQGSPVVRHMVFDRVLESEEEMSSGQEHHDDNAISSANYSFTLVGQADLGDSHCYVVEIRPKRIEKYLFEGTLWVDSRDFAIVQISGRPAKKLSFWIKHADFVRQYRRIDGFWLPYRDGTVVDVRASGTQVFRIEHRQYVINAADNLGASELGTQD
jgi:hypothetical protein